MIENEYRVRAVTRWVVTHFEGDSNGKGQCAEIGEYANQIMAEMVAMTFAKVDPRKALYTTSIDRYPAQIIYPAEGEPIVVTDDTDVVAEFTPLAPVAPGDSPIESIAVVDGVLMSVTLHPANHPA